MIKIIANIDVNMMWWIYYYPELEYSLLTLKSSLILYFIFLKNLSFRYIFRGFPQGRIRWAHLLCWWLGVADSLTIGIIWVVIFYKQVDRHGHSGILNPQSYILSNWWYQLCLSRQIQFDATTMYDFVPASHVS